MDDLQRALDDIGAIRMVLARTVPFRGYGPATVGLTGAVAIVAAAVQSLWITEPMTGALPYLVLWVGAAVLAVTLCGVEIVGRARRAHGALAQDVIAAAVGHMVPAGFAGAALTVVLWRFAPATLWMLPGLWQIVFGLGIFAAARCLPKPIVLAGFWYLLSGLAVLALARDAWALSPWAMGLPFGIGQSLVALILFVDGRQERDQ